MEEALLTTNGSSPLEAKTPIASSFRVEEKERTCTRCGKVLATRLALHKHLNKVFLCDRKGERRHKGEMRQLNGIHRCEKCGENFSSSANLRYHWSKVNPCDSQQSGEQHKKIPAKKKDKTKQFQKCPKCKATFSCSQNLRLHLSRLIPCDNSEPKQHDPGNKTCTKCNVTFTSAQSLRLHLTRTIPCDAQQRSEGDKLKCESCPNCRKKFASEWSLNIHLGQRNCDGKQSSPQPHNVNKVSKTRDLSRPDKGPPAKESLDEYLLMASHRNKESKPIKEQHRINDAPLAIRAPSTHQPKRQHQCHSSDKFAKHIGTSKALSSKRKKDDEGRDDISPVCEPNKRVRREPGSFADLAARASKTNTSTQPGTSGLQNTKHGGNILTDGCCCRECVRTWTRTMMNRFNRVSDEVTSLREQLQRHGESTNLTSEMAIVNNPTSYHVTTVSSPKVKKESNLLGHSATKTTINCSGEDRASKTKAEPSTSAPPSGAANAILVKDTVKLSLTENYNHLNDQIITNERALEDSAAYLKEMSGHDDTDTSELRSQLDELKVYIDVEKGKRDEVAAAIIAQRWASKRNEFRLLLENMTVKSKPNAEKAFHEECAEIASQLEEKNKVLAKLGGLIGAAGVNSEKLASMKTGIGIPKYAVEKTAKSFLERQRDDIFMCLLRSSPRIYVLTKEKLDGTMN